MSARVYYDQIALIVYGMTYLNELRGTVNSWLYRLLFILRTPKFPNLKYDLSLWCEFKLRTYCLINFKYGILFVLTYIIFILSFSYILTCSYKIMKLDFLGRFCIIVHNVTTALQNQNTLDKGAQWTVRQLFAAMHIKHTIQDLVFLYTKSRIERSITDRIPSFGVPLMGKKQFRMALWTYMKLFVGVVD